MHVCPSLIGKLYEVKGLCVCLHGLKATLTFGYRGNRFTAELDSSVLKLHVLLVFVHPSHNRNYLKHFSPTWGLSDGTKEGRGDLKVQPALHLPSHFYVSCGYRAGPDINSIDSCLLNAYTGMLLCTLLPWISCLLFYLFMCSKYTPVTLWFKWQLAVIWYAGDSVLKQLWSWENCLLCVMMKSRMKIAKEVACLQLCSSHPSHSQGDATKNKTMPWKNMLALGCLIALLSDNGVVSRSYGISRLWICP